MAEVQTGYHKVEESIIPPGMLRYLKNLSKGKSSHPDQGLMVKGKFVLCKISSGTVTFISQNRCVAVKSIIPKPGPTAECIQSKSSVESVCQAFLSDDSGCDLFPKILNQRNIQSVSECRNPLEREESGSCSSSIIEGNPDYMTSLRPSTDILNSVNLLSFLFHLLMIFSVPKDNSFVIFFNRYKDREK